LRTGHPYMVAYDHNLEEPGNLEVEYFSTFGTQRVDRTFTRYGASSSMEPRPGGPRSFTFQARPRFGDSTVFTGYRWRIGSAR